MMKRKRERGSPYRTPLVIEYSLVADPINKNRGPRGGETPFDPKSPRISEPHLLHHRVQIIPTYGIEGFVEIYLEEEGLAFTFFRPIANLVIIIGPSKIFLPLMNAVCTSSSLEASTLQIIL